MVLEGVRLLLLTIGWEGGSPGLSTHTCSHSVLHIGLLEAVLGLDAEKVQPLLKSAGHRSKHT